jgi:hypothetical protein
MVVVYHIGLGYPCFSCRLTFFTGSVEGCLYHVITVTLRRGVGGRGWGKGKDEGGRCYRRSSNLNAFLTDR